MAKNNGIVPQTHECETCGKRMAPQGITQHQRKLNHTGITIHPEPDKFLVCPAPGCDRAFTNQFSVDMHYRRTHGDLKGNPNNLKALRQHVKTTIQTKPKETEPENTLLAYVEPNPSHIVPIVSNSLAFKPLEDALLLIDNEGHIWMAERLR